MVRSAFDDVVVVAVVIGIRKRLFRDDLHFDEDEISGMDSQWLRD